MKREYNIVPIEGKYDDVFGFCCGLAEALYYDGRVGFIGHDGRLAIPVKYHTPIELVTFDDGGQAYIYSVPADFEDGLSCVSDGERFGYIGTDGERRIPFLYEEAEPFCGGCAKVRLGGEDMYIDTRGQVIFRFADIERDPSPEELLLFEDGLVCVIRGGKLGYVDVNGSTVVPFIYDDIWGESYPGMMCEGLISVRREGKWGYVDASGREVIPAELEVDYAGSFRHGYAVVTVGDSYGLIDTAGNFALKPEYDNIRPLFGGELFAVRRGDTAALLGEGLLRVTTMPKADRLWSSGEYILARVGGKMDVFDKGGRRVEPLCGRYHDIVPHGDVARVCVDERWGVVSLPDGEVIVPTEYETVAPLDDELYSIVAGVGGSFVLHIE